MGSKRNVASGNDHVAIQVGHATGRRDSKPAKDTTPTRTQNVRTGNARVGRQVDEIRGDLTFGG